MGQVQSDVAAANQAQQESSSSLSHNSQPSTMESLIAEAVAYGNEGNESLDVMAEKALQCPCISDLRNGPCGNQFSDAFVCFLKSTAEEKGSDCVHPFVALQSCIKAHPGAFSKDVLDNEEVEKEEEPKQEYKIIPPIWSTESQSPKSKL
ncbi:mitochondrial intermembrane space import and assembly protein 40 homolog [Malania oleifera]|uniref:mitochondrial intermembrane space import and assembly protein 40 homolog n=1 Tax=Malania oleifera TaxID=397392 RepID=UPI0025AE1208|nr:mitochondrial intermembrane space import and assembly protein 40 homolog [Malania oleifera]